MPKRTDIDSVLIVGAGPIVIGQACEFDYSGTQACHALREEGYRVALVNSNPATIMTDPDSADAVYVEPVEWRAVAQVIERERPQALLPTMGGQTALNCALDLEREGVLERFGVELIGARRESIDMAENRELFRRAMDEIGLESARSVIAHDLDEARAGLETLGVPLVVRPSFTLGGSGGGIVYNREEFEDAVKRGLAESPTSEVLLEESLLGWKEYEMEVVRDLRDNCIIVCSIENVDPMGVHTGDSITVAPALTLTDKEYQRMRDASLAVLRKIGVDTGGSNVQFAVHPGDGRMRVIEMNPRVSRSSALASKATGFPIAKVAAKLAVGYTLDELRNEITAGATPSAFEPTIDYVVVKAPRFDFEKFPGAAGVLGTQMQSVGEVMALGGTFKEALQKALRGLETGIDGLAPRFAPDADPAALRAALARAGCERLLHAADAFRRGWTVETVHELTRIDPWFLHQLHELVATEAEIAAGGFEDWPAERWRTLKRDGFADARIAALLGAREAEIAARRRALGVRPAYKRVDTCAAEFATETAYLYSTYEDECEAAPSKRRKAMILGGGPNRIGQGIEFDYCCVHAARALKEAGVETIMVNCNPETVSTDFDVSDRLYFEPLTFEDVSEIIHVEGAAGELGVIIQCGGQTPLKLARRLKAAGARILGTQPEAIDRAEDRESFQGLLRELGLKQPANATARAAGEALRLADGIGYPLVVRPSYVLGGRAMEIVADQSALEAYMRRAERRPEALPVLLDRFLSDAVEVDVDAVSDGKRVLVGGVMQHIEQAGVHSGDSACSLPPYSLDAAAEAEIRRQTEALARALSVVGLMNVQFAVKDGEVYVLEVNPRASRTAPFVSKATGLPLAKLAVRCMAGLPLEDQAAAVAPGLVAVKEAVLPFAKFPGVDPTLGPEMRSTGEVMGLGGSFPEAFEKAQRAAGARLPAGGVALISVRDSDKPAAVEVARLLAARGFELRATRGTRRALEAAGLACGGEYKVGEGRRPHIVDRIKDGVFSLIVNTTAGRRALADSFTIRGQAVQSGVCYTTTMSGARAIAAALDCGAPVVRELKAATRAARAAAR